MFRTSIILKNAREDKDLSIAEVSKKLKISPKYLEAIESENRSAFPSEPYCSLIIKDYANFLGLNGDDIISLFRRDFAVKQNSSPVNSQKFSLTPQTFFIIGLCLTLIIFVSYVVTEYLKYNQAPSLKVNWPEDTSLTLSSKIEISGTTDAEATVRINSDLIIVDQFGSFKKIIALSSPEQKIVVESLSHSGKTSSLEKTYHPK
ncbi:helix-turn-helix domain-containing protein [Candidatus Shapirobacteria bacterium]|nr:helix-turn-helix domain-containing protein [Candidatus Shapirobacteria bacterium]